MTFIYRDYQLNGATLLKPNMRSNHLLYKKPFHGAPAIDAENVWDVFKGQVEQIECVVHYQNGTTLRYSINGLTFDQHKQELNLGFGIQYAVPKKYWKIEDA